MRTDHNYLTALRSRAHLYLTEDVAQSVGLTLPELRAFAQGSTLLPSPTTLAALADHMKMEKETT